MGGGGRGVGRGGGVRMGRGKSTGGGEGGCPGCVELGDDGQGGGGWWRGVRNQGGGS